jgi:hypothetical protein
MPKKILDAPDTIVSVTLLPTGRLLLATEKRLYELVNNVLTPMEFAPDPEPVVETPAPTPAPASPLFPSTTPAKEPVT